MHGLEAHDFGLVQDCRHQAHPAVPGGRIDRKAGRQLHVTARLFHHPKLNCLTHLIESQNIGDIGGLENKSHFASSS
jgi:hypothetical protein